jgi:hypothetical protein
VFCSFFTAMLHMTLNKYLWPKMEILPWQYQANVEKNISLQYSWSKRWKCISPWISKEFWNLIMPFKPNAKRSVEQVFLYWANFIVHTSPSLSSVWEQTVSFTYANLVKITLSCIWKKSESYACLIWSSMWTILLYLHEMYMAELHCVMIMMIPKTL